jgi:hypothetical protein
MQESLEKKKSFTKEGLNTSKTSVMELIHKEKLEDANRLLMEKILNIKENEELKYTYKSDLSGLKTLK